MNYASRDTLALAAFAAGLVLGRPASAASAENGKRPFSSTAAGNATANEGRAASAPSLPPIRSRSTRLQTFVRTTNRNMPPFHEAILSNDDLADIYAYLQSIPKGPTPRAFRFSTSKRGHGYRDNQAMPASRPALACHAGRRTRLRTARLELVRIQ